MNQNCFMKGGNKMNDNLNIEEQYQSQWKEIKRYYRKRKLTISLIFGIIAIILLTYAYLSYKRIIEQDDLKMAMTGILGIGAAVIAIRMPFHQSHSEYIQLRDLNSAYTHERFRQGKG